MKHIKELQVTYTRKRVDDDLLNCDARAPHQVYKLFKYMQDETREKVVCVHLSAKGRVLSYEVTGMGTANHVLADVHGILRGAILSGATEITIIHNHPMNDPDPSYEDIKVYEKLKQAALAIEIPVRDFIIIGDTDYYSFDEKAIL